LTPPSTEPTPEGLVAEFMAFDPAGSKRVDDAAFRRVDADRCADVDIHRFPTEIESRRIERVPEAPSALPR
jgi:hypothetical protein